MHRDAQPSGSSDSTFTADTSFGPLVGLDRGATKVFKGIEFAVADRFAQPERTEPGAHPADATRFGAQAPQNAGTLERMLGASSLPTSERCLHLNVYTPAADDRARPVLFWIHGGAFLTGGGATPWYDGSRLVEHGDVVVVTINYRLGALGFLGEHNCGTGDMLAALGWVRDHIASFGGDPGNVTIFGESAGGSAVLSLSASPAADELFHRAWAMSPSILQLRGPERAATYTEAFLERLEGGPGPQSGSGAARRALSAHVADASAASVEAVLEAQAEVVNAAGGAGLQCFAPTEDTALLPRRFEEASTDDARPLVIGTTRDEMLLFTAFDPAHTNLDDAGMRRRFERRFADRTSEALDLYRHAHPGCSPHELTAAMETHEMFTRPARRLAERRAAAGTPTWVYEFDFATAAFDGALGSCHGLDIPFAFDNLHRPGVEWFTGDVAGRQEIADDFAGRLLSFSRSDDPGWTPWTGRGGPLRSIGPAPHERADERTELWELWESTGR